MSRLFPVPDHRVREEPRDRPFEADAYDRVPLTPEERGVLREVTRRSHGGGLEQRYALLDRLARPVREAVEHAGGDGNAYCRLRRRLFVAMHRRGRTFWEWSGEQWAETVAATDHGEKTYALVVGYLLGGITGMRLLSLDRRPAVTARKALSAEDVDRAAERLRGMVEGWGYGLGAGQAKSLEAALCRAMLLSGSPRPDRVTQEAMDALLASCGSAQARKNTRLLSRVLYSAEAKVWPFQDPREDPLVRGPVVDEKGDRVLPEWRRWCDRWLATSTLASREHVHMYLLKVGRWLTETHPEVQSPEQWDQELAIGYIAAVDRMKTGDWGAWWGHHNPRRTGKPSQPRSKDHQIYAARAFFRDLQEWGWIPVRFDPGRCIRTPRSIASLIGPNPRTIDAAVWAKLVAAGLDLAGEDLPRGCPYPVGMIRALATVWLFAGLRADEIVRLRVGCARRHRSDATVAATGETLPEDAVCFLDVPTNKTSTAFTKPVHPVVAQRIAEWEAQRPPDQPEALDRKTGELVRFLFSVRNRPVAKDYLNNRLIPLLCRKAGVPENDSRGKITSHRARATIASQLYNGPEPLSLTELQAWLGHKDPKSTQSYARIDPTRLAKKYADSAYLERNAALVEVLLDVEALKSGEGALYYELGHGLCSNPYWQKCPHRMACVRCEFYVAGEEAQYVRAKKGVRRMLEQIPLTDEERRAAEGDELALDGLLQKNADVPTPTGPTPRELGLVPLSRKPTPEA